MPTTVSSNKKAVAKTATDTATKPNATSKGLEAESPELAATNFTVGDLVRHPMFGDGRVVSTRDDKLTIDFDKVGKKEILDCFIKRAR